MVSLICGVDHRDGVTLVTARLEGTGVAQRVRLVNRLDGPVWPPHRHGVPEAGWEGNRFETVVPADEAVAVGYASPAPPTDSPLAIAEREVVDENAREDSVSPADALRDLGDPAPPRDAVPIPVADSPEPTEPTNPALPDQPNPGSAERRKPEPTEQSDVEAPEAVESWLDAVEQRVTAAERLEAAETVPEATVALRAVGCLEDAETLVETLRREANALESVASRAERLAEQTAAADVPLSTFERLA